MVYLRPNIFVVLDRMILTARGAKKPHVYQARWHVDTLEVLPALKGHPSLITTPKSSISNKDNERARKNRNRLIVAPLFSKNLQLGTVSGKSKGDWTELGGVYAVHPFRVTTTITHTLPRAKGEQRFLTMFVTLGNQEANPLKSIVQKGNIGTDAFYIGQDVGGEKDCGLRANRAQDIKDLLATDGVEGRGRLIANEQLW